MEKKLNWTRRQFSELLMLLTQAGLGIRSSAFPSNRFFFTYSQHGPSFINLFVQFSQSDLPPLRPFCGEVPGRDSNPGRADLVAGTLTRWPPHLTFYVIERSIWSWKRSNRSRRSFLQINVIDSVTGALLKRATRSIRSFFSKTAKKCFPLTLRPSGRAQWPQSQAQWVSDLVLNWYYDWLSEKD